MQSSNRLQETVVFGQGGGLPSHLCAEVCCHPDASQLFSSASPNCRAGAKLVCPLPTAGLQMYSMTKLFRIALSLLNKIKHCSHVLWNSSNGGIPNCCSKEAAPSLSISILVGWHLRISRMSSSPAFSVLCNRLRVPPKSNHSTLPASGRTLDF